MRTKEKHFSDLSAEEVAGLWGAMIQAAAKYARKVKIAGLQEKGSHDVYAAVEIAVEQEYAKSRAAVHKTAT